MPEPNGNGFYVEAARYPSSCSRVAQVVETMALRCDCPVGRSMQVAPAHPPTPWCTEEKVRGIQASTLLPENLTARTVSGTLRSRRDFVSVTL